MALQGTLETFTVPDVLRLLSTTKKTGLFTLEGDRGAGKVWLGDGRIEGATSDREHGGDVDSVLFDLLRFTSGAFCFVPDEAVPDTNALGDDHDGDVEQALERAEQLLVEWREIESVIPSMDAWVRLLPELEDESVTIDAALWSVLAVLGGGSTGRRVGSDLELGELEACRRLRDLVDLGVAEVDTDFVVAEEHMGLTPPVFASMDPPPPPPPPPSAFTVDPIAPTGYDDEPVLVDHGLSNAEVASLGANLASFVARPADSTEPEADDEIAAADERWTDTYEATDTPQGDDDLGGDGSFDEEPETFDIGSDDVPVDEMPAATFDDDGASATADPADPEDVDEFLSQLSNLSPKAAAAIEATNGAPETETLTSNGDDAADLGAGRESDEELNKNLLLKFLSSAKN